MNDEREGRKEWMTTGNTEITEALPYPQRGYCLIEECAYK